MWVYEKKLEFPINVKKTNAKAAQVIMSQLGGPHGELGAANRYLAQRYTMPLNMGKAMLTDIATSDSIMLL